MDSLMHADIFFFVTTIAVALVSIGLTIALIYIIKILSIVEKISTTLRTETDFLAKEMAAFREKLKNRTPTLVALFGLLRHYIRRYQH